nr:MAG TPA_asm: hypothetical protein [Caudoviricetes sp.]
MSKRKKCNNSNEPRLCSQCIHASNPRNLSLTGVPTLATCRFEKNTILYQRECVNDHFKPK